MMGYFPTLFPGEMIYSVVARMCWRMRLPRHTHVLTELFGATQVRALVHFPRSLDKFVSALPPGHSYATDQLIDEHTPLPAYSPFLPEDRTSAMRAAMRDGTRTRPELFLRCLRSIGRPTGRLRFCPLCWQQSRQKLGEAYWQTLHQIPGVLVCPHHNVFLEDSEVARELLTPTRAFIAADEVQGKACPRPLDSKNPDHQLLLRIASDVEWLLRQPCLVAAPEKLQTAYCALLENPGAVSPDGRVNEHRLRECFANRYPTRLLQSLQCEWESDAWPGWPVRLLTSTAVYQAPIRHLLMIRLCGSNVEEFFSGPLVQSFTPTQPFGSGPWSCLNPVCEAAHPIRKVVIKLSGPRGCLGHFECPACGFHYSRWSCNPGHDGYRILRRGPLWENTLKRLWDDSQETATRISSLLGADRTTVERYARKLGCRFRRAADRPARHMK
jgi:hypothetical protein